MFTIFRKKKSKLAPWVERYRAEKALRYPLVAEQYYEFLLLFAARCDKEIVYLTRDDVDAFVEGMCAQYSTHFMRERARIAVRCFLIYCPLLFFE